MFARKIFSGIFKGGKGGGNPLAPFPVSYGYGWAPDPPPAKSGPATQIGMNPMWRKITRQLRWCNLFINFVQPTSGRCTDVTYGSVLTFCIAVPRGSFSKQMTLNVDLDLSKVNGDIWRRCWTSVPDFVKIGLFFFEKGRQKLKQNRLRYSLADTRPQRSDGSCMTRTVMLLGGWRSTSPFPIT